MLTWFLFSILSAFGHSIYNVLSKKAGQRVSKTVIVFWSSFISSIILWIWASVRGFPEVSGDFWSAAVTTAILNVIATPILLRAYQLGELTSVFPMLFTTPVFMVGTSFLILGEAPTGRGFAGMLITLIGLFIVARSGVHTEDVVRRSSNWRGMLLGLLVAFLYSFSANFDKLSVTHSDRVFGPAVVMSMISIGTIPLLLLSHRKQWQALAAMFRPARLQIPTLIGLVLVFDMFVFYTALSIGFASYTILVKRTSIIFGVLWGWLFFNERNLAPKIAGILVALGGLALLLTD